MIYDSSSNHHHQILGLLCKGNCPKKCIKNYRVAVNIYDFVKAILRSKNTAHVLVAYLNTEFITPDHLMCSNCPLKSVSYTYCICVYYLLLMISYVVKKSAFQLQNAINLIIPRISGSHTRMCNTSIILMYHQLRYFLRNFIGVPVTILKCLLLH